MPPSTEASAMINLMYLVHLTWIHCIIVLTLIKYHGSLYLHNIGYTSMDFQTFSTAKIHLKTGCKFNNPPPVGFGLMAGGKRDRPLFHKPKLTIKR